VGDPPVKNWGPQTPQPQVGGAQNPHPPKGAPCVGKKWAPKKVGVGGKPKLGKKMELERKNPALEKTVKTNPRGGWGKNFVGKPLGEKHKGKVGFGVP